MTNDELSRAQSEAGYCAICKHTDGDHAANCPNIGYRNDPAVLEAFTIMRNWSEDALRRHAYAQDIAPSAETIAARRLLQLRAMHANTAAPVQMTLGGTETKLKWPDGKPVLAGDMKDDDVYDIDDDGTVHHNLKASALQKLLFDMEANHQDALDKLATQKPATPAQTEIIRRTILVNELAYRTAIVRETFFAEAGEVTPTDYCEYMFTIAMEHTLIGLRQVAGAQPREVVTRVLQSFLRRTHAAAVQEQLVDMPTAPQPKSTGLVDASGRPIVKQ